jgi:hypothetical protein
MKLSSRAPPKRAQWLFAPQPELSASIPWRLEPFRLGLNRNCLQPESKRANFPAFSAPFTFGTGLRAHGFTLMQMFFRSTYVC